MSDMKEDCAAIRAHIIAQDKAIAELEEHIDHYSDAVLKYSAWVDELTRERDELKREHDLRVKEIDILDRAFDKLKTRCSSLQQELDNLYMGKCRVLMVPASASEDILKAWSNKDRTDD